MIIAPTPKGLSKKKGEAFTEYHRWHLQYCFAPTWVGMLSEKCSFWTAPDITEIWYMRQRRYRTPLRRRIYQISDSFPPSLGKGDGGVRP